MELVLSISFAIIFTTILIRWGKDVHFQMGIVSKNYQGKDIPMSMGIIFPLIYLMSLIPLAIVVNQLSFYYFFLLKILWGFSLIGFLDDIFGTSAERGLGGHIKSFLHKGIISTGLLKAIYGILLSLFVVRFITANLFVHELIVDIFIIALSANAINSLDLKPGRAVKGFLVGLGVLLLITNFMKIELVAPILVMVLIFAFGDLKANFMMGDAGSNSLGAILGGYMVVTLASQIKIIMLILLIMFHVLTEYYSFSKIIENSIILSWFDEWGR